MPAAASAEAKPSFRMIAANFASGVIAMVLAGLVAPTLVKGTLSLAYADVPAIERREPVIAPLDLAALRADLAEADRALLAGRAATDGAINRLETLSGR